MTWFKDHWDAIVGFIISAIVAIFAFYRRVFKVEDTLAAHVKDDDEMKKRLDDGLTAIADLKVAVARQDVMVAETRSDIKDMKDDTREIRGDIKKLLERS